MTNPAAVLSVVLLIAGVSLMLVVHILVVFWALRRGLGGRGTGTPTRSAERTATYGGGGLSPGELVTLPCHDFKSADGGGGVGGDCAVCLEAFEAGDRCRQLPRCEHSSHAACVDSWLRKNGACPVCRADVVVRPPKAKAAASSGVVEMAERRSSSPALEIVVVTVR